MATATLKRFHVIVAEAGIGVVADSGPGQPLDIRPAPAVLDIFVEVPVTVVADDGTQTPVALQHQIKAALEAARPVVTAY